LAAKRQLPEMFGKEAVLEDLFQVLSKEQQNNALVVGPPGSGKSTLIKSLSQELVRGVKYPKLRFKRLVSLDVTRLSAGANSSELNTRLTNIIAEIRAAENIILFVDEVHNLASINQDSPETADVFIALEPVLSQGAFQFIGATSTSLYKKFIEPNEAFSRLFSVVNLNEASLIETLNLLEYLAWESEKKNQFLITFPALERIIALTNQYVHDRVFPDKAVHFLDELVASSISQNKKLINTADVDQLMERKTKIPIAKTDKAEKQKLLNLEVSLHQQVIGQDAAIKAIADAVRRARTNLKKADKPIASFLFAGPTGVGKTETAKALAGLMFGSENQIVRLDMSEYQNLDSLNRLIGSPPGSKDSDLGGQLTETVKQQPYSVVLLDEIEKAHEKILNLFLQVLDEARLTDSQGKLIDFQNTIIIATTNVGTKEISKSAVGQMEAVGKQGLEDHFPPEFLNRFTDLIIFSPLTMEQTKSVVKLKLNDLIEDMKKQEIKLSFADEVIDYLSTEGYSTKWGGRQLDRIIQEKIANLISQKILKDHLARNQSLHISAADLQ
jgi:ATP-dependent Clp protease ATP-binding subunit ClpC